MRASALVDGQTDTTRCGHPNRDGSSCRKRIRGDTGACSRHSVDALTALADRKEAFLDAFDRCYGNAAAAASCAGISRSAAYEWRDQDPEFRAAWDRARATNANAYISTIAERFFDGWEEDVWWHGRKVGTTRKFDNRLGMFMLKALDDRFSDRPQPMLGLERDPTSEAPVIEILMAPGGFAALNAAADAITAELLEGDRHTESA